MIWAARAMAATLAFAVLFAIAPHATHAEGPWHGSPAYAPLAPPPPALTVLRVENPKCCGQVACVKVCLPPCCDGPPKVCPKCDLLHRGVVTYRWRCGYCVTVMFTHLRGVVVRQG